MILFALLMGCLWAKAQSVVPQVNENVELMSILSRMAGFQEYHMDMAGQYIKDMDSYFKDNTAHPAVGYMQALRNKYGISFDAVMSMAIHLDNRNGTLSLIEEDVPTLDKRWMEVDKGEFLSHLNNFYKETKFNAFFKAHKSLYEKGIKSYQDNIINHFDIDWYPRFYGNEPQEVLSRKRNGDIQMNRIWQILSGMPYKPDSNCMLMTVTNIKTEILFRQKIY